jgi:hypothetical protein
LSLAEEQAPSDVLIVDEEALIEHAHVLAAGTPHPEKAFHHPIGLLLSEKIADGDGCVTWLSWSVIEVSDSGWLGRLT